MVANEKETVSAETNETVSADMTADKAESAVPSLKVYRKKSTFKGATDKDFWYSATLSNGASVILKFNASVKVPDLPAFEVSNVVGNAKHTPVHDDDGNLIYDNYIYYVSSCDFSEIKGETLPL